MASLIEPHKIDPYILMTALALSNGPKDPYSHSPRLRADDEADNEERTDGLDSYLHYIVNSSKLPQCSTSLEISASGIAKFRAAANSKRSSKFFYYSAGYRIINIAISLKHKPKTALKKAILKSLQDDAQLISKLGSNQLKFSEIPGFAAYFAALNLCSYADFSVKESHFGELNYQSYEDYSVCYCAAVKELITDFIQHPDRFLTFLGLNLSKTNTASAEILNAVRHSAFTSLSGYERLKQAVETADSSATPQRLLCNPEPYQEPAVPCATLPLDELSLLPFDSLPDVTLQVLSFLPNEDPKEAPSRRQLKTIFTEFYFSIRNGASLPALELQRVALRPAMPFKELQNVYTPRPRSKDNPAGEPEITQTEADSPSDFYLTDGGYVMLPPLFTEIETEVGADDDPNSLYENERQLFFAGRLIPIKAGTSYGVTSAYQPVRSWKLPTPDQQPCDSTHTDFMNYYWQYNPTYFNASPSIIYKAKYNTLGSRRWKENPLPVCGFMQVFGLKDPALLPRLSEKERVRYYLREIALKLLQKGAFIPQYFELCQLHKPAAGEDLDSSARGRSLTRTVNGMRWIPAINLTPVRELTAKVGACLRGLNLHRIKDQYGRTTYLLDADNMELGCAYLSMFLTDHLERELEVFLWGNFYSNNYVFYLKSMYQLRRDNYSGPAYVLTESTKARTEKVLAGRDSLPEYFAPLLALNQLQQEFVPVLALDSAGKAELNLQLIFRLKGNAAAATDPQTEATAQKNKTKLSTQAFSSLHDLKNIIGAARYAASLTQLSTLRTQVPWLKDVLDSPEGRVILKGKKAVRQFFDLMPTLQSFGFESIMSKGLNAVLRPRQTLQFRLDEAMGSGKGFSSMLSYLDYDAKISLGDYELTAADYEELKKNAGMIVQFREHLVYVDEKDLELMRQVLIGKKRSSLSMPQVIAAMLGSGEDSQADGRNSMDEDDGIHYSFAPRIRELVQKLRQEEQLPLPQKLQATLRPYQERGYVWLMHNLHAGLGSIIADDMGLGKTVQVLSALLRLKEEKSLKDPALIVMPASLLFNWQHEIRAFAPGLSYRVIYSGAERTRGKMDLHLTTYTYLTRHPERFSRHYSVLIADEAQNIKNPQTQASKALRAIERDCAIAMTGTPVENHLTDYWAIMDLVNPGLLGKLETFKSEYVGPIEKERDTRAAGILRRAVTPFVLRRLKTDRNIIQDLPEKLSANQYCSLTPLQSALYEARCQEALQHIAGSQNPGQRFIAVFRSITSLKQICDSPAVYDPNSGHDRPEDSGKIAVLLDLLSNVFEQQRKVIIFTQFIRMGKLLQEYLENAFGFRPDFLNGSSSVPERQSMIEAFQTDPDKKALILSLKAGGAGINLTAASVVIHVDLWWNPAVENQATDRAFRIGQVNDVQVYRLIVDGTVEEKIDEKIRSKQELNELTVTANEKWLGDLSDAELSDLMTFSSGANGDEDEDEDVDADTDTAI